MIIDRNPIAIDDMLNSQFTFYAHTRMEADNNYECDETIAEHTGRCITHFKEVVKEKGLEDIFLRFEHIWCKGWENNERNMFYDLLLNTITFHDIGKINPLFQKDKMKNTQFAKEIGSVLFLSRHAEISAMIYLEYFLPKVLSFPKEIKKRLILFTYVNAYIISKHHTKMDDIKKFIDALKSEDYNGKWEHIQNDYKKYFNHSVDFSPTPCKKFSSSIFEKTISKERKEGIFLYAYAKLMFSLLVAVDYYATSQYVNHYKVETYGTISNIKEIMNVYEKSDVVNKIRNHISVKEIDVLRSELFIEAEEELLKKKEECLFYLEAPTGSGKSNTALNLSFQLIKQCPGLQKIWYIYPFNTLVEQNRNELQKLFENTDIMEQVSVVNSITSIVNKAKNARRAISSSKANEMDINYNEVLLDRQFFHFPIVLSTHITLFDILFGKGKESGFPFYQLVNSVIVLDEIQSYRNEIWSEIIIFLKEFAEFLNLKVIIMSATLPDLDLLSKEQTKAVKLIKDREKYFMHSLFKNRVEICYDLLEQDNVLDIIVSYIKRYLLEDKKVLIEFLSKKAAEDFFSLIMIEGGEIDCPVRLMTGDDNSAERKKILNEIKDSSEGAFLLIATQVVEAGVDLQGIDIGFKDISMLDAEEQFMGRINRSCTKEGKVYFFNLNKANTIYGSDIRLNQGLTLESLPMRTVLEEKEFSVFYQKVFEGIIASNESSDREKNLDLFFRDTSELNFKEVSKKMYLIQTENEMTSIFFSRILEIEGTLLNGAKVWEEYKALLLDRTMDYAKKRVKLSEVKSKMSYFIYQIRAGHVFSYNDQIGEIYFIEEGEAFFENGKLNKDLVIKANKVFI